MFHQSQLTEGEVLVSPHTQGGPFSFTVETMHHAMLADEPHDKGGDDLGPPPYDFVAMSLATCTAMTLRLYAKHKGFDLGSVQVKVKAKKRKNTETGEEELLLTRSILCADQCEEERLQKLNEIANKCPVHKSLQGTIAIETETRQV